MKKLFLLGVIGLILFEMANVYFIMPMPGSQGMRSIEIAYFLYSYRWYFRIILGLLAFVGIVNAYRSGKWLVLGLLAAAVAVVYMFNFEMAADVMFFSPSKF